MKETKFTPGPWSVAGDGGFINQLQINPTIGCAYGAGDEVKANAHLIAAAPDLYEALEELLRYANDSDDCQYGTLSTKLVKDIAKAALAKARGEE